MMTDNERFERALAAAIRERAPTLAPASLVSRVKASLASGGAQPSRRHLAAIFGAAAAAAVLVVVAAVGSWIVQAPGQTPRASSSTTALGSPAVSAPPATAIAPSAVALPEPITHPGNIQTGDLLTP